MSACQLLRVELAQGEGTGPLASDFQGQIEPHVFHGMYVTDLISPTK